METLKRIIDIVDKIKSENGTIKQAWDQIVCMSFKMHFVFFVHYAKIWPFRREQSISFYCTWMPFLYVHFIYYYSTFASLIQIICVNFVIYFVQKNVFGEGKCIVLLEYFILDMKISEFINYALKLPLYYINQNYASNLENIMNLLNHVCFLHPMNML